jgi:hypothetical protein
VNPPDLVQELGQRLNLTGLTLNGGVCRLVFDQSLPIDLEDDGLGNLCFHTVVAPLPHEGREALFAALLSAHLFGLETDGAVFGLHPKTDELYLFRSLPVDNLSVDHALDVLERFTQQAESWKKKIESLVRETTPASNASSPLDTEALRA